VFELAAQHGLTVAGVSIRNQRSRWGSCSRAGRICLNWRLVAMPEWVRDYVILHELMHLKRMDHSPRFWALVAKACPRYQDARRWLRQHPRGAATQHARGAAPEHPRGAAPEHPRGAAPEHPRGAATEHPGGAATQHPGGAATQHPGGAAAATTYRLPF